MKIPALITSLALIGCAIPAIAADEKPAEKSADSAPVTAPATDKIFMPKELDALKPLVGKVITVEGKIERQGESKTRAVRYLNFTQNYRDSVSLVFFVDKGGEAFSKEKLTEWLGKKVRVTGTLAEHNGNLQIQIEKWEQVQEVPEPQPAPEAK